MIRKYGPLFVLFNGAGIVAFALTALILPEAFWGFLNIQDLHVSFARVMAWYLLVFGLGGLAVWRDPARHPWVVLLMGLEKIAPALLFPHMTLKQNAHWLVLGVGVFDGIMAVLLISYVWWLRRSSLVDSLSGELEGS